MAAKRSRAREFRWIYPERSAEASRRGARATIARREAPASWPWPWTMPACRRPPRSRATWRNAHARSDSKADTQALPPLPRMRTSSTISGTKRNNISESHRAAVWSDSRAGRMPPVPSAREVAMQRISNMFHHRARDDFGEGDHQEYVETGLRDVVVIGAAAALLIGVFVASLV